MLKFSTRAIHKGFKPSDHLGSATMPIFQVSTFKMPAPNKRGPYSYSRTANPTRSAFESVLSDLCGGSGSRACSSGMAAIDTVLGLLNPGDSLICCDNLYGGTFRHIEKVLLNRQIRVIFVDASDVSTIASAISPETRMIWLETPTNPLMKIYDIPKIVNLAQQHALLVVVDNTFMTPFLQRPLELGVDIEVQSITKYIAGHSDIVGGGIIAKDPELLNQLSNLSTITGNILGPFDCWLAHRGIKTLAIRMKQHCKNAEAIALYLNEHPKVETVYYPGLESHPGYDIHKKQASGFGGMLSVVLRDGEKAAIKFLRNLRLFLVGGSLGGVESLASHPPSASHRFIPRKERIEMGIVDGLVRLSVGIEDVDDLIVDIEKSLQKS